MGVNLNYGCLTPIFRHSDVINMGFELDNLFRSSGESDVYQSLRAT